MAPSRPDGLQPVHHRQSRRRRPSSRALRLAELSPTFAGTDHLEDHLCSAPVVKPGLLIQHLLLLHFLFLQEETDRKAEESTEKKQREAAVAAGRGSESGVSPQRFSLFLPPPLLLLPRRSSGREHVMSGWLEVADKAKTQRRAESEVPLPSCQRRRCTRDLLPKSCKHGKIINKVVK